MLKPLKTQGNNKFNSKEKMVEGINLIANGYNTINAIINKIPMH